MANLRVALLRIDVTIWKEKATERKIHNTENESKKNFEKK